MIGAVRPGSFTLGSKVIAHTISNLGNEIITWECAIPKWMVAEFNTHKVEIERNSASSRAVPMNIIIDMITEFPCMPHEWRYNASGMSPQELMSPEDVEYANCVWLEARDNAIESMRKLQNLPSGRSADKQRANRIAEFCMGTIVVCTMTTGGKIGMNNFFGLRDSEFAQPEFGYVAKMMHEQYHESKPEEVNWHLPYITEEDFKLVYHNMQGIDWATSEDACTQLAIVSSARCGRVTHYRQGQSTSIAEDLKRGWSFAENGHYSPLRHAARAGENAWYGNMYGWNPISKIIMPHDYVTQCCERAKS